MEGAETPSAVSVVDVITAMLLTLMRGIALVSGTEGFSFLIVQSVNK